VSLRRRAQRPDSDRNTQRKDGENVSHLPS
jgi:hypothetical protein